MAAIVRSVPSGIYHPQSLLDSRNLGMNSYGIVKEL